jgi:hypothetical protein
MKTIPRVLAAGVFGLAVIGAGPLRGQQLQLQISPQSISFSAADPDTMPQIAADRSVLVQIKVTGNRSWQLTLRANGNLTNNLSFASIDISNISWTATSSPPFQNGILVANVPQRAAGSNGNFNGQGELRFVFQNRWTYWAGNYSQTVTFTLALL